MFSNVQVNFSTRQVLNVTGADTLLLLSFAAKEIEPLTPIQSQSQISQVCGAYSPMGIEANIWFRYGGKILAVNLWDESFTTKPSASYPISNRVIQLPDTQVKNVTVSISGVVKTLNTHYTQDLEKGTITFFPTLSSNVTAADVVYDYPNYTTPVFPLTLQPIESVDSIYLTQEVEMDGTNYTLLQGYADDLRAFIFAAISGVTATNAVAGRYDNTKWWFPKYERAVLLYPDTLLNSTDGVTDEPSPLHVAGALSRNKYTNKWNGLEGLEILGAYLEAPIEYSIDLPGNGITTFERFINQPTTTIGQYTAAYVGDQSDPLRFFSTRQTQDEIYSVIISVNNRYRGKPFNENYIQLINSVLMQELIQLGGEQKNIYNVKVEFDRPNMVIDPTNKVTLPYIVSYRQRTSVELLIFNVVLELTNTIE